jgi:hypothetical protein
LLTILTLLLALTACGGENSPLSTGEQGGQVPAPDTLEGDADTTTGNAEEAEANAVDNTATTADDIEEENVEAGDAETIGDATGGQGGATTGGEGVTGGANDLGDGVTGQAGGGLASPAFVTAWESGGATVTTGGEVPVSLFDGATGQTYLVNDAEVQVYQFEDEASAEAAAATVSSDGGMIGDVSLRWAGPPHFYLTGDTIVVYVGDDAETLSLLNDSLGAPFAGSGTTG